MNNVDGSDVPDIIGLTVVNAQHLEGDSDSDEQVILTMSDGTVLSIGTSEWLYVEVSQPKGTASRPATTK